jgi:hypothetical protein
MSRFARNKRPAPGIKNHRGSVLNSKSSGILTLSDPRSPQYRCMLKIVSAPNLFEGGRASAGVVSQFVCLLSFSNWPSTRASRCVNPWLPVLQSTQTAINLQTSLQLVLIQS